MKKITFLLFIFITFFSCQDTKKMNQMQRENEKLKKELEEIKTQKSSIKFVWTLINFTYSASSSKNNQVNNLKKSIIFSDIKEINNYDVSIKYRLEDQLEKDLRNRYMGFLHSIQERETFVFETYEEASEFKFQKLNR